MKSLQQLDKPTLLVALEHFGFSWLAYSRAELVHTVEIYQGYLELERFMKLAAMPFLQHKTLMVCARLDISFWHPIIHFLNKVHPYSYRGFCIEHFGSEIPHVEGKPDFQAYQFTIDMMKKVYGQENVSVLYWDTKCNLPDCTKAPVVS